MVCSFSINLKVPQLPQNKNLHFLSHKDTLHNLIAPAVRTKDKGAERLHRMQERAQVPETQLQQQLLNHMEIGVIPCTEVITNHRN